MELQYLGTAAAEGFPALFCDCPACESARAAGGKNIRTRSQAIIDSKLLIDFCPDTYLHVLNYSLNLRTIEHCLLTHGHSDHLYPLDFNMRRHGYAYTRDGSKAPSFNLYGSEKSLAVAKNAGDMDVTVREGTICFHTVEPYRSYSICGYTVTPLKARHDSSLDPLMYIISDGVKTLLYAHDTGLFPDETMHYLTESGVKFDFISLDCTGGLEECGTGHLGLPTDNIMRERLYASGCADKNTVFCLHHFSHNGKATYDELKPIAAENGYIISYDSMKVKI